MSHYAIEVDGPGCWINEDIDGDHGRTLVPENATIYSRDNAIEKIGRLIDEWPRRSFDMRLVHVEGLYQ